METKKERRDRLTLAVERRRKKIWDQRWTGRWANPRTLHWFDKGSVQRHRCAKRRRNNPRAWCGICTHGSRERIYEWRAVAREVERLVVRRREDPADDRW